jgi:hypothetical protein
VLSEGERFYFKVLKTLDFIQIHYKDEQKEEMYDFATPYFNKVLTPYFENSVIAELVPHCKSDYVGVCSWRLKKKRGDMFRLLDKTLTKEKILNADFDVAILTPRSPSHNVMGMASHWHGKAWDDAIKDLRTFIKIPNVVKHAVYENHFIARRDIYQAYVTDMLNPVIDFMSTRDAYFVDSGYRTRKSQADVEAYTKLTGRKDYPIAPFVLERLFSIWINDKNFKVIPL